MRGNEENSENDLSAISEKGGFKNKILVEKKVEGFTLKNNKHLNHILNEKEFLWSENNNMPRENSKRIKSNKSTPFRFKSLIEKDKNSFVDSALTDKNWKEMWSNKIKQLTDQGFYTSDNSDKKWFTSLGEKRRLIKSKYTFNPFLSSSQSITYNFNKNIKKLDLNSLYKLLKYFFKSLKSLISVPVLEFSPEKIKIRLFYYILPSLSKIKNQQLLNKYIINDDKLYKEKINRRKYRSMMTKIKMRLFISKWKEDNNIIRLPMTLSLLHSFNFGPLSTKTYKMNKINDFFSLIDNCKSLASNEKVNTNEPLNLTEIKTAEENVIDYTNTLNLNSPYTFTLSSEGINLRTKIDRNNNEISQSQKSNKSLRKVTTMVNLNKDKFKFLIFILEKLLKKTIILDLIRLKYPYHNSNILAQVLGLSSKKTNFRLMMRKLLYITAIKNPTKMIRKQNFTVLPSYLSGIKVKLAGRLITQRVIPRFTVQSFQIGSLARGKISFTNSSRFTNKNKRGAFSFTVTTGHIF